MAAKNCQVTCCDVLEQAYKYVQSKRFGLACINYDFNVIAKHYIHSATEDCLEIVHEVVNVISYTSKFLYHTCQELVTTDIVSTFSNYQCTLEPATVTSKFSDYKCVIDDEYAVSKFSDYVCLQDEHFTSKFIFYICETE